ncbi:MAG: hypothetical protein RLZZ595_1694 [Bacteroidota bacterium]|jgi:uncharacterized protein (TIRG00374 family)
MVLKGIKSIIQFTLFLSLGIFLLWYTTRSFTPEEIKKVKSLALGANWLLVIPCIGALVISHFIRALRWKMLIEPLGKNPSNTNTFLAVLVGFFLNLLFPRLGEIMKCSLLGKYEKIPVDQLIGTMVTERVIDVMCLLLVITLTILFQLKKVGAFAGELTEKFSDQLYQNSNNLFFFLAFFASFLAVAFFLFRKFKNNQLAQKLKNMLRGVLAGALSIRKIKNIPSFLAYTLSIWFLYLLSIRLGFYALGGLDNLGWPESLTLLTFGSFAMIATQGGIGAYQLAIQKTLLLYSIPEVLGLAFGWLLWLTQTLMLLITGPIALFLLYFLNTRTQKPKA